MSAGLPTAVWSDIKYAPRVCVSRRAVPIGRDWEIVGVAGDTRRRGPSRPPDPAFYVTVRQQSDPQIFVFVRGALDAAGTNAAVRAALTAIDHSKLAPIHTIATLADRSAETTRRGGRRDGQAPGRSGYLRESL